MTLSSRDEATKEGGYNWLEILATFWRNRKLITVFVFASTLLAIIVVLLIPSIYTAETTVLPETLTSRAMGIAGVADLAAAAGLAGGDASQVARLFPMIIQSSRVLHEVIYSKYQTSAFRDSVNLIEFWGIRNDDAKSYESALATIRNRMEITYDNRLATLTLRVEMEEPKLASDVANRITAELDSYSRTKRRTSASAQREFIEQRLTEVGTALGRAEDLLKGFREKNRRLADSPLLMLEQDRLQREVLINSTIFVELKKQLEVAKIEEVKNIPLINILDPARIPVMRSGPKRRIAVSVTFLLSLALALGFVVARENPVVHRVFDKAKDLMRSRS